MDTNTANREQRITTVLNAPIELVWKVWAEPEHIARWWGPEGFTNTIQIMDFKEGGEWKFIMHGPDGTNYPNRSIFREIIPLKKIVYEHFNPHFIATVLFNSEEEKVELDWTMLFDSEEMYNTIVRVHKADEGQKQNIEKLKKYLANR